VLCPRPEIKEVKLRPVTEKADYDTKVKQAQKFLSKGAKVKLTMTFSGREMRFKDQGKEMMLVSLGMRVKFSVNCTMNFVRTAL
jgi:translation initiation factor IF-3